MQTPSPIAAYADRLAQELSFDPPLARRVRQEIEDHLWEAASEGRRAGSRAAQVEAIERFGDPRSLARQYLPASVLRQAKRTGTGVVLVMAAIFFAMMGRVAWYSMMHWTFPEELRRAADIAVTVNKTAFVSALIVAAAGWAYLGLRRSRNPAAASFRKHGWRSLRLSQAAACALLACLVCDVILLGLRAAPVGWSITLLPPFLTYAAELACFSALLLQLRRTAKSAGMALAESRA